VLEARGLGQVRVSTDKSYVEKDARIVVAVRPEKLLLSRERQADEHTIPGRLATSAYLGSRSHFFVSVDGSEEPVEVASHESDLLSGEKLERGSDVWLSWAEESLVLLPAPRAAK